MIHQNAKGLTTAIVQSTMILSRRFYIVVVMTIIVWVTSASSNLSKTDVSIISINSSQQFQTITGFGLNVAGPYFRDDQKAMFDMFIDDLGVTMFRVAPYLVYSDWEFTNDNDDPGVMNWEYYNDRYSSPIFEASWKAIRYLNSRGIRPVIAVWGAAPSWMLDEKSTPPHHAVCQPASKIAPLKPSMYPEFAEQVVSMLMYARSRERLEFQYFSPFNETDCYPPEGPRIDPDQTPEVLAVVARRLQKEGLGDIRLAVADQALITNDYITPILKNPEVMKQVGAFTFHTYVEASVGPHVERTKASQYPDTPIWLTEYGDLNDLDKSEINDWKSYSLNSNRRALLALNQGANALFYFNAFDDYEECSVRLCYYGLFHSADHVYYPKKRYFAAKQLYHFVRPGARRVGAVSQGKGLTVSAFQNPGGSLVMVGVKEGGPDHIQINLRGSENIPESFDLYLTSPLLDCVLQGPVRVHNGVAELDLPEEAIFTLVASPEQRLKQK